MLNHRLLRAVLLCLVGGLVGCLPASAEEPTRSVRAVVDEILSADKAGDDAGFEELARQVRPDPWRVAEELCVRGAPVAAKRFAALARVAAPDRLQAYVETRAVGETEAKARSFLKLARAALKRGSPLAALSILNDLPATDAPVFTVEVERVRGEALLRRREFTDASEALWRGSQLANEIGWARGALELRVESADSAARGGVHQKALSLWQEVIALAKHLEDERLMADGCTGVGTAYRNLEAYPSALTWHERARQLYAKLEDRSGLARALGNQAIVHRRMGQLVDALALQQEALAIHQDLGDEAAVATTLGNIGVIHAARGELELALASQREALALKERLRDVRGAVFTLTNIGMLHVQRGDFERALDIGQRALDLNTALDDDLGQARALTSLGNAHAHFGDYPKALDLLDRARSRFDALGRRADLAAVLSNLGVVHRRTGNLPAAEDAQAAALLQYEALADPVGRASAHVNLGVVHQAQAAYPKALAHHLAALEIAEAHEDHASAAAALGGLGNAYLRLGAYERALEFHERSRALHEVAEDRRGMALALTSIGALHALREAPEDARASLERARTLFAEVGDTAAEAGALVNLAFLLHETGNHDGARKRLHEALERREKIGDDAGAALARVNLGLVDAARGEREAALAALEQARAWAEDAVAAEVLVRASWGLATTHLTVGEPRKALADAHAAVKHLGLLVGGQDEEIGAQARTQFLGVFETGARAGAAVGDTAEVAHFLESGRAGALLEALGGRDALRAEVVAPELRRAEAEARAAERRALARFRHARSQRLLREMQQGRRALQAAQEGVRRVIERIQREAKASANLLYPTPDDLKTIRGRLRAGEALVLYGLFEGASLAVVCSQASARLVRLAARDEIEEACDALLLGEPPYVDEGAVTRLRALLIEPLALEEETKCLLISPDGLTAYAPFCLLEPDRRIAYVPSATTFGHLRDVKVQRGKDVLALGDPDYIGVRNTQEKGVYAALYRTGLVPLLATRAEVEAVGDVVRVGAQASEKGFREVLATRERWRAIHFACHGLIDSERPTLSSLALSVDDENDGFLTAIEVFRMRTPADLVVLSACETGKGRIYRAEGIVGLTRAFMFAGAPSVICSLWKVDDEATQALMVKFYELWDAGKGGASKGSGLGAAAALREAQRHIQRHEKWAHPYYWAAWVLWGLPG